MFGKPVGEESICRRGVSDAFFCVVNQYWGSGCLFTDWSHQNAICQLISTCYNQIFTPLVITNPHFSVSVPSALTFSFFLASKDSHTSFDLPLSQQLQLVRAYSLYHSGNPRCNQITYSMTRAKQSSFLHLPSFMQHFLKLFQKTTLRPAIRDMRERDYLFFPSHLSPGLKHFLRESDSSYLRPTTVAVTPIIGTFRSLLGLLLPLCSPHNQLPEEVFAGSNWWKDSSLRLFFGPYSKKGTIIVLVLRQHYFWYWSCE